MGRDTRPSPSWAPAVTALVVAAIVGLAVGVFLTYDDTPSTPLPDIALPADDAVRDLQRAAEQDPDDAANWQALGVAATNQAIATADPAWYAVAEEAFDRAAELDPADPFTTIAQGQLTLSLHDFTQALELGQQAVAELPDTADAYGVLTDAQVELGSYDEAADSVQRMLDLRPDLPALARASYLRQLNGDLDGAIVAMRQAETAGGGTAAAVTIAGERASTSSSVSALLGDLLLHRGDLEQAEEAYVRAQTPAAAAGLARITAARGDLDRATDILSDLSLRAPVPAVVTALAEVQERAGDDEGLAETVALARTIATLQQEAGQTVDLELALFEASFGDPAVAVELAQEAYEARPDNVFAAGSLAWALHQDGHVERARELAERASRLGTIDTAHELRMAEVLGEEDPAVLSRNPVARDLYLP